MSESSEEGDSRKLEEPRKSCASKLCLKRLLGFRPGQMEKGGKGQDGKIYWGEKTSLEKP